MKRVSGYSATQIGLHWVVAALVAAQYIFKDSIAATWDAYVTGRDIAFSPLVLAHVAGGVLILILVVGILGLRRTRGVPLPPDNEPAVLKTLSHVVHWGIYAMLILMPMTGGLAWFGDIRQAADAHNVLKIILLALVAVHILAVPFHRFVLKNNIMLRMIRPGA